MSTEKDAMALAVLDKAHGTFDNIRFERRHDKPDVSEYWTERIREVIEARAHLASRIAELESERNEYRADAEIANARATRAEAELAAVLNFLRDDSLAATFQTLGQYRAAAINAARGGE